MTSSGDADDEQPSLLASAKCALQSTRLQTQCKLFLDDLVESGRCEVADRWLKLYEAHAKGLLILAPCDEAWRLVPREKGRADFASNFASGCAHLARAEAASRLGATCHERHSSPLGHAPKEGACAACPDSELRNPGSLNLDSSWPRLPDPPSLARSSLCQPSQRQPSQRPPSLVQSSLCLPSQRQPSQHPPSVGQSSLLKPSQRQPSHRHAEPSQRPSSATPSTLRLATSPSGEVGAAAAAAAGAAAGAAAAAAAR